jgi:hypothetical protein
LPVSALTFSSAPASFAARSSRSTSARSRRASPRVLSFETERIKASNCCVEELALMEEAGGRDRVRCAVGLVLDGVTGESAGRGRFDSAERNLLTCFLCGVSVFCSQYSRVCHAVPRYVLLVQVLPTLLVDLTVPKVAVTQHVEHGHHDRS